MPKQHGRKGKGKGASRKRGAPSPNPQKTGRELGAALMDGLLSMAKQAKENEQNKAKHAKPENPIGVWHSEPKPSDNLISLRTPDAQRFPLTGWVQWVWYIGKDQFPCVVADLDIENAKYHLSLDVSGGEYTVRRLNGNSGRAMALAEALISAADWEKSWTAVLGADTSEKSWGPYDRRNPLVRESDSQRQEDML